MDRAVVDAVIHEIGAVLRADGGDLVLVDADPRTARIEVALVLDGVTCQDCIMPPAHLRDVVEMQLRTALAEEFEFAIDDPRGA